MLNLLSSKIRKMKTPFWGEIYKIAKDIRTINMPAIWSTHHLLRGERGFRLAAWGELTSFFYYEPIFRAMCNQCGRCLRLIAGIPLVSDLLHIRIGNDVTTHGAATFSTSNVYPKPEFFIGDHSYLGYQMNITVGQKVEIGRHALIAGQVVPYGL